MSRYKVCVCVTSTMANYIDVEAVNELDAEAKALKEWYAFGPQKFSSKCIEETVDETQVEDVT